MLTLNIECINCGERVRGKRFRWHVALLAFEFMFTRRHRSCASRREGENP